MKHKLLIIFAGLLLGIQHLVAQESRTITLKEAIDLTLSYSKTLKLDNIKMKEAAAAIKEAYEKKQPDASIGANFLYLPFQPNIDLKSGSNTGGTPAVNVLMYSSANISLPVFTGGRLEYGIESAKYLEQAVKLDAENERQLVILNVVNASINLFKAHVAITLVKENLQQFNKG